MPEWAPSPPSWGPPDLTSYIGAVGATGVDGVSPEAECAGNANAPSMSSVMVKRRVLTAFSGPDTGESNQSRPGGGSVQQYLCRKVKYFVIPLILWAGAVSAGEQARTCDGPAYRQFDFWRGHWSVTAGGQQAGHNRITAAHNGCLLEERWRGASGTTGTSLNFYDPLRDAWRQLWVSEGVIIDIAGGLDGPSMALDGTISYTATGDERPFRGLWTPLDDGRVRQFFEEYRDDAWQTWFEGFYEKDLE